MSRTKNIIGRLPHFFQSDEKDNHLYRLAGVFAALLDEAEEDLLKVMRAHWVNTADNEGSKGFDTSKKGDLDKILALFLENLGGTSLLRQTGRGTGDAGIEADRIYRDRMKGLIQVLLSGASTKEGIREIVGANLGILGNDPAAQYARETIRIEEFLPEIRETLHKDSFLITENNPNPEATWPEITIELSNLEDVLIEPRIVHVQSGASWSYRGSLSRNDELIFRRNGTGLYNGNYFEPDKELGGIIFLQGENDILLSAKLGYAEGRFDLTLFDKSKFEDNDVAAIGVFDYSKFDDEPVFSSDDLKVTITVKLEILKPASFSVIVPWDIPGFSVQFNLTEITLSRLEKSLQRLEVDAKLSNDILSQLNGIINQPQSSMAAITAALSNLPEKKIIPDVLKTIFSGVQPGEDLFKELSINPRSQIKFIVDKVKAAGVYSVVVFEKRLTDTHEIVDRLELSLTINQKHEIKDILMLDGSLKPYPNILNHEINEKLLLSGVFDFSAFDSMNGFS